MWLFTRIGFYSVTAGTDNKIQIRARNREHLYNLKDEFPKIFKDKNLMKLENRDYRFRFIVTKEEWKEIAAKLTSEVGDYSNFKGECGRQVDKGYLDKKYESLLHTVWHDHMAYQSSLEKGEGKQSRSTGGLGYRSSYKPLDNTLWRDKQSQVYDNDFEDEDHVLNREDAKDILHDLEDLDVLPAKSQKSLFIDTDIGEVFSQDQQRFNHGHNGKKKHKKR